MNLTVNGEVISKASVELEYQRLLKAYGARLSPEELARRTPAIQRQAMDHTIGRKLLLHEARRLNIKVLPEEIDPAINELAKACSGETGFHAHLKKLNLSLDALRLQIQEARQIEKLIGQITASCPDPTEEDITAYFEAHPDEFVRWEKPQDAVPPLEHVRARIRLLLRATRKNQMLTDTIARLKQNAVIEEDKAEKS